MLRKVTLVSVFLMAISFTQYAQATHVNEQCRVESNISCVDLSIGIWRVDTALESQNISYTSLGELLFALKNSEQLFATANQILESSVGISFDTIDSFYAAVNKCGLVPQVIDEIRD